VAAVLTWNFQERRRQADAEALLILGNERALASSSSHYPPPVQAAVAAFAVRAGEKLRRQSLRTRAAATFLQTDPFDREGPRYFNGATVVLEHPTADSGKLVRAALQGLERIFRPGLAYRKAGVLLPELEAAGLEQGVLFSTEPADDARTARLMATLDRLNRAPRAAPCATPSNCAATAGACASGANPRPTSPIGPNCRRLGALTGPRPKKRGGRGNGD
jgi:hypothetical protein